MLAGAPGSGSNQPMYGDFSKVGSYHENMTKLTKATEAFESMPSDLRTYFNNDPGALLDFIADPENREEAEELGLVPKPKKKSTVPDPKPSTVPAGTTTPEPPK